MALCLWLIALIDQCCVHMYRAYLVFEYIYYTRTLVSDLVSEWENMSRVGILLLVSAAHVFYMSEALR